MGWRFHRDQKRWHYFTAEAAADGVQPSLCRQWKAPERFGPSKDTKKTLSLADKEKGTYCRRCYAAVPSTGQRPRIKAERFAAELLKANGNQTEAYQACRNHKGSRKAAKTGGVRMLAKPSVQRAIGRVVLKLQVSNDELMANAANAAVGTMGDYYDARGNIVPLQDLTPEARANIASIETLIKNAKAGDGITDEVLKLKTVDKLKAIELVAKLRGLLKDTVKLETDEALLKLLDATKHANAAAKRKTNPEPEDE